MAALAGEVSKQIKGHSEGAKGFRPWWDTIEDNLLYGFVILGLITLPMTFFSRTPIECTPHGDEDISEVSEITIEYTLCSAQLNIPPYRLKE